jgi:hypothetical protein
MNTDLSKNGQPIDIDTIEPVDVRSEAVRRLDDLHRIVRAGRRDVNEMNRLASRYGLRGRIEMIDTVAESTLIKASEHTS